MQHAPNEKKQNNAEFISRLRNWDEDFIVRGVERVKRNGEVFTPTPLVDEILDYIPVDMFFDKTKTFLDPTCGNGQFLSAVLIRKLENGISLKDALSTIYGVDIMMSNVETCQERLLCGVEEYRYIVEKNIVCADALSYNFSFE